MDFWDDCELTERIEGKQGGVPLVKGTRIPAQTIVDNFDAGSPVEEVAENYPSVPAENIRKLIDFAHSHQAQPR